MVRSDYQKIRIEKVGYRGWNTADWEFTYTDGGTKYRTVDRGFVVNDHQGYALMYTAKAADWGDESAPGHLADPVEDLRTQALSGGGPGPGAPGPRV
ncbi:hypothetical protein SVIOM342S_02813 [Streptomyces violaceorubidus]